MLNRVLSLALACVILGCSLVVPAHAAEIDQADIYNLLDFATPDGKSDNTFYFASGSSITYTLPTPSICNYVDMVIRSNSSISVSASNGNAGVSLPLTVTYIGDGLYRVYGSLAQYNYPKLILTLTSSTSVLYGQIISLNLFFIPVRHSLVDAYCNILSDPFTGTIHYVPSDTINYRSFVGPTELSSNVYELDIYSDNWKKYDFMDYELLLYVTSVSSLTATFNGQQIPLSVQHISSAAMDHSYFYVSVRLDLRGLDRSSTVRPEISISGQLNFNASNTIEVISCSGYVISNSINPLFTYFNQLKLWIQNLGDRIVTALNGNTASGDDFKDDSSDLISDLDDISGVLDSVQRPSMDNVSMDFTGNISGATSLMATTFSSFTSIPWVNTIFMASITLALISYILFGKE